jgi:ATP-dependent RNA helicase SUPV3L1/SUV3
MARRSLPPQARARGVTAVLGPTNTGKTHLAIERMCAHTSGMIGLPLRLLAREVYARVVEKAGVDAVALVTGEEKIKPERPRFWISTVEAMPRDLDVAFVAIDEIQLCADLDRGHVFTDRLLNQRGRDETMLIGSGTARPLIESLVPGVTVVTRPRLSQLTFAGEKKVSRLPPRSAIVAFSVEEVYAVAELIRRQRGGAAVVLGALSPRTRNAQVQLYQAGEVDYLVATDAIGMGLNLDVGHVAFAASSKFDGFRFRRLHPAEIGQIAGRAGRHLRDGTFGTTGRCDPFEADMVEAVENHRFEPMRVAQWRNADLDFRSLAKLQETLAQHPQERGLTRAPTSEDEAALGILAREDGIRHHAESRAAVERLWEVCQVPDYRKVSPASHADLVGQIYRFLMEEGRVRTDWFARQIAMVDRTDGDIDALSTRIAHVRTWTFVANRPDWLADPEHWQRETRRVEDTLSDALHERLASRFVDRRTSVLMRRLRENAMLEAEITATGDVTVEGQHVGQLHGFHFIPDPQAAGEEAKALRNAAGKALAGEIERRAERFAVTPDTTLVLSNDGTIRWTGDPLAKLEPGDKTFEPSLRILADEQLTGPARDKVETRLKAWLKAHIVRLLGPVIEFENAAELTGLARGIAFQVAEALGVLERARVAQDLRSLDQAGRASLRAKGVRFGSYHVYMPALLKPAPRTLAAQLWALKNGGLDQPGIDEIAHLAGSGRTSFAADPAIARGLYRAAGFRVCGARAVRVDILERLADLIRPAIAYRPGVTAGDPPPGSADAEGFVQTPAMTSLVGTSGEDFGSILRSLGYVSDQRPGPAITVPLVPARVAAVVPAAPVTPAQDDGSGADASAADHVADGDLAPVPTLPAEPIPDGGMADTTVLDPAPSSPTERWTPTIPIPAFRTRQAMRRAGVSSTRRWRRPPTGCWPKPSLRSTHLRRAGKQTASRSTRPRLRTNPLPRSRTSRPRLSQSRPNWRSLRSRKPPLRRATRPLRPSTRPAPSTQRRRTARSRLSTTRRPRSRMSRRPRPTTPKAPRQALDEAALLAGAGAALTAGDATPDAAGSPAEPVLIEVWRLQRHTREAQGPSRHRSGSRSRPQGPDARGGPRQDAPGGRPNRRGPPPRREQPAPAAGVVAARAEGEPTPAHADAPNRPRPEGDRRPDNRASRSRLEGFGRSDNRPDRPRPDRPDRPDKHDRPRPERQPFADRPRPEERRERAPDPNSPFAKLAALKAQLEGKGDGGTGGQGRGDKR